MSVQNATLLAGAPTAGFTGGTSKSYSVNGTIVTNGIQIQQTDVADIRVRPTCSLKNFNAQLGNDGFYGKQRREITHAIPYVDAITGKQKFASLKMVLTDYPDFSEAARADLLSRGAQSLVDPDFAAFLASGALV